MPMKNPPHPGEIILEDMLKPLGVSIDEAARKLRVRRATLSDLCNGKASLTGKMAVRMEEAFGVSADMMMRMQASYELAQARLKRSQASE